MEPGEYDALVAKANQGSYAAATELLQFMRTHKVHQPELVLVHGGMLLKKHQRKLSNELWTVMEQVFLAAVAAGHEEWQEYCLKKLMYQWPKSIRVQRLKGLYHESREDYEKAKEVYTDIINEKPEDTIVRKRLIAIYKQRGKMDQAIEEINKYLDVFSTDSDTWHELAQLYIEAGCLKQAVYCYEELMLSNPRSVYHILTYAELLYSVGDYELARKYFSLASYLDGGCLRALWGLVAVNMALAEKDKGNEKLLQMGKFANERLAGLYKDAGPHGRVAITMLKDVASSS
jgi:tetratricopeptide (TPR) repeat protein